MSKSSYNSPSILEEFLYRLISRIEDDYQPAPCPYMDNELREWMANHRSQVEDRKLRESAKLKIDPLLQNIAPAMKKALLAYMKEVSGE